MTDWRAMRFPGNCKVCGLRIDPEAGGVGYFRTDPTMGGQYYCQTHKDAYDTTGADPDPQPTFTRNAASTPTLDLDALAKATADLTFTKVADHFVGHVMPEVAGALPNLVREELTKLTRVAEIKVGKAPSVKIKGTSHRMLPTIVRALVAGVQPFIVGPAGSGKTTLAEQCAEVLGRKFYFASRVTSEFKLLGFVNAQGATVRTPFREAFEYGGLFLFDEIDASDADAFTSFNAALSNRYCDFPDGMVHAHKDFCAIAAGNTYGRGADRQYVGRTQLDAATLDRFAVFDIDYDEELETALAGNVEWSRYVQSVRHQVELQQIRHIVSPRASIDGAKMLASGEARDVVCNATIWKGLDASVRRRIESAIV